MSGIEIRVNMKDTLAKLDELISKIEEGQGLIERLADEMVDDMVMQAKILVPVRTGQLQESIHSEGSFPSYQLVADAVDTSGIAYGGFVEFGTSLQEAQPYMWPAIHDSLSMYIPLIRHQFKMFIMGK